MVEDIKTKMNASPKSVVETKPEAQNVKVNPSTQSDSSAKLIKLKELYDGGLITKSEYDAKRSKILESL